MLAVPLDRHVRRMERTMDVFERVCRAICAACDENPDHKGDARGNEFRWQDYADAADAAISAMHSGESCKWECTYDGGDGQALYKPGCTGKEVKETGGGFCPFCGLPAIDA